MGSALRQVPSEVEQARTAPEFGAHTPLSEKLLAVAIRAQNFTGSTGVAIALTEGDEVVCRANWGTRAPEVGATLSLENSFTGLCVRTGEPLCCDDAQSDPRVDPEACQALGISAIAAAPVRRGLKVIGVIAAFSDTPNAFTDKHLLILTTLADVVVELLDDPHPVQPMPQAAEVAAPDLARGARVGQAPVAPRVDETSVTTTVLQEPAVPLARAGLVVAPIAPATPVQPEPPVAGTSRRWLLPPAILAIVAVSAFAAWRLHVARSGSKAKPVPTAQAPEPQSAPAPQPAPAESKHSPFRPPPIAEAVPSPVRTARPSDQPADLTIRRSPQPVVEVAGPVRRPEAQAQVPQLALSAPDLPAALAKPAPTTVVGPVSRFVPARVVQRVEPVYPETARRLQVSGRVVVKTTITKSGAVADVQWVSGSELFRDSAVAAVKQWRYQPASLNGQPIESDLEIVFQFHRSTNQ